MTRPPKRPPPLPPGTKVTCPRCGKPCTVRRGPREGERPLTCSNTRKGLCANCAVTRWLKETFPELLTAEENAALEPHRNDPRWRIDGGPAALLLPHIQQQFEAVMRVGNCPVSPDEIDWPTIVANWNKEKP